MEIQNLTDKETITKLPLIFQTLQRTPLEVREKSIKKHESRYIKIDFYQSSAITPYPYYRHISKIFTNDDHKSK